MFSTSITIHNSERKGHIVFFICIMLAFCLGKERTATGSHRLIEAKKYKLTSLLDYNYKMPERIKT